MFYVTSGTMAQSSQRLLRRCFVQNRQNLDTELTNSDID